DNKQYQEIFQILTNDSSVDFMKNANGVFLNLSDVNEATLDKVVKYLKKNSKKKVPETNDYEIDEKLFAKKDNNEKNTRPYKMSNYDKYIIRQKRITETIKTNEKEYEKKKTKKRQSRYEDS